MSDPSNTYSLKTLQKTHASLPFSLSSLNPFMTQEIRATARVLCDANPEQFSELYTVTSCLASAAHDARQATRIVEQLRIITTDLRDGSAWDSNEFNAFLVAYVECWQQLPMAPRRLQLTSSPASQVMSLTSRINMVCKSCGVMLVQWFPCIKEIHVFFIRVLGTEAEIRFFHDACVHNPILSLLMQFLCGLLQKALATIEAYERLTELSNNRARPSWQKTTGESLDDAHTAAITNGESGAGVAVVSSESYSCDACTESQASKRRNVCALNLTTSARVVLQESIRRALVKEAPIASLPYDLADAMCRAHADLRVHFSHLSWYMKVFMNGASTGSYGGGGGDLHQQQQQVFELEAAKYLNDTSLLRVWTLAVGARQLACTAKVFEEMVLPALFPEPLWEPIMNLVNYQGCGVVSLYSIQRLLKVWGPLSSLKEHLQEDLTSGAFCLSKPFEYLKEMFTRRPDAAAGDYVISLTKKPGEVYLTVLYEPPTPRGASKRAATHHGGQCTQQPRARAGLAEAGSDLPSLAPPGPMSAFPKGHAGMVTTGAAAGAGSALMSASYRLSPETGAWTVIGLTREEFASIAEMCKGLSSVFRTPCGEPYTFAAAPLPQGVGASPVCQITTSASDPSASMSFPYGVFSTLHRACYHNNSCYVRTLLTRGAATIINTAVIDPAVNPHFCWTPLLCAVVNPHSDPAEVVTLLLEAGADVHYKDDAECTALYYAITNGYATAVRLLLQHCPTLQTSPWTVPLLMSLGASWFFPRSSDIIQLAEVLPVADVVDAVASVVHDYELVELAARILHKSLLSLTNGKHGDDATTQHEQRDLMTFHFSESESHSSLHWTSHDAEIVLRHLPAGREELDIHIGDEALALSRIIELHDALCCRHFLQVRSAMHVLFNRCFFISVQDHFKKPME